MHAEADRVDPVERGSKIEQPLAAPSRQMLRVKRISLREIPPVSTLYDNETALPASPQRAALFRLAAGRLVGAATSVPFHSIHLLEDEESRDDPAVAVFESPILPVLPAIFRAF